MRAHSYYGGGHVLCFISDVRVLWNASQQMKKNLDRTFSSFFFFFYGRQLGAWFRLTSQVTLSL